jgi:hypothetical protein
MSWEQLQNKPKGTHLSIDGFYRTEAKERELNSDMAAVFSTIVGEKVLDYLRSRKELNLIRRSNVRRTSTRNNTRGISRKHY